MTPQDKIKVLAEMDRIEVRPPTDGSSTWDIYIDNVYQGSIAPDRYKYKNYPESRDAIMPLIVKWCGKSNERWYAFQLACAEVSQDWTMAYSAVQALLEMSPSQLADALIKAAGKWKD